MRLAEDYVRLRLAFNRYTENESFGVTMQQLADILCCTPRNVRLIIARLSEQQWIHFQSGRGRGHISVMTFYQDLHTAALEEATQRALNGDVPGAFAWLKQPGIPADIHSQFVQWLTAHFGYTAANKGQHALETLRLPIYRPVVCLDPANAVFAFDTQMISQLYSRLVEYDAEHDVIQPGLAHHWESDPEGYRWTFYMYKHIRFHDHTELTAYDAAASLYRLQQTETAHSWLVRYLADINVVNSYTLTITLRCANMHFPLYMSHTGASVLPKGNYNHQRPVGSGPYQLGTRTASQCVLECFDSYYGQGALLDRIEVIVVPEQEAPAVLGNHPGMVTVVTGEFDTSGLQDLPRQRLRTGVAMMMLNPHKPGWIQDESVRHVLTAGIDRSRMSTELGETREAPAQGLYLSSIEDWSGKDFFYDQSAASEHRLLTSYNRQSLHLYTFQRHEQDAYWLQQMYQQFEIQIEVHIVSWEELNTDRVLEQADLVLFEAVLQGGMLRQLEYIQSSHSLVRRLLPDQSKHRLDLLNEQLLAAAKHNENYQEWLLQVNSELTDQWRSVFLVERSAAVMAHASLQGIQMNERGWVDFSRIWYRHP